MTNQPGLGVSFNQQEGSGEAQILATKVNTVFQGINAQRVRADAIKRKAAAGKRKEALGMMKADGQVWEHDRKEIQKMYDTYLELGTKYGEDGVDIADPSTDAFRVLNALDREIKSKISMSTAQEKAYNDAKSKFNPNEHDEEYFGNSLNRFLNAKSIGERDQLDRSFLTEQFNEYEIFNDVIKTPEFLRKIEDGDLTTVTGGASVSAIEELFDGMMSTPGGSAQQWYEQGLSRGRWSDEAGAKKFFKEILSPSVKSIYEEREDENTKGMDINFNGGGGGGRYTQDDLSLDYDVLDLTRPDADGVSQEGEYIVGSIARKNKPHEAFYVNVPNDEKGDGTDKQVLFSPTQVVSDLNGNIIAVRGRQYVEKGASGREIANVEEGVDPVLRSTFGVSGLTELGDIEVKYDPNKTNFRASLNADLAEITKDFADKYKASNPSTRTNQDSSFDSADPADSVDLTVYANAPNVDAVKVAGDEMDITLFGTDLSFKMSDQPKLLQAIKDGKIKSAAQIKFYVDRTKMNLED